MRVMYIGLAIAGWVWAVVGAIFLIIKLREKNGPQPRGFSPVLNDSEGSPPHSDSR